MRSLLQLNESHPWEVVKAFVLVVDRRWGMIPSKVSFPIVGLPQAQMPLPPPMGDFHSTGAGSSSSMSSPNSSLAGSFKAERRESHSVSNVGGQASSPSSPFPPVMTSRPADGFPEGIDGVRLGNSSLNSSPILSPATSPSETYNHITPMGDQVKQEMNVSIIEEI
mmetsp:Transcript_23897/g.29401  ORF Transcript_23897/g.29401 Transcript_23897/m.29401 type:complete len:166 (-) Transcript_23897:312-809(-)